MKKQLPTMATVVAAEGSMKEQFSISMERETKEKLQRLAGLKGRSLSAYLEDLGKAAIAEVDAKTWNEIERLLKKVDGQTHRRDKP
ncbi:hypothetical protein ANRL3_00509 [Anaerolineae bacterium]|nr:hypothetical protein ANRL3_00509 [Anaerolineae bacterium]